MSELPDLSRIQNKVKDDGNENLTDLNQISELPNEMNEILNHAAVPPIESPEEVIEKRKLILMIHRYILEFEKHLPHDLHSVDYREFSKKELINLLQEIRFTVSSRNCGKMMTREIRQGLILLETLLVNLTPLKVQGLSTIMNDDDFVDTLKELSLENMEYVYQKPQWRIAYALLGHIGTLHLKNSQSIPINVPINDKVKELVKDFDKDIETIVVEI